MSKLITNYKEGLDTNLSKIVGLQAELQLKDNVRPVFLKARSVPFKLIPMIDKELERLYKEGIWKKIWKK